MDRYIICRRHSRPINQQMAPSRAHSPSLPLDWPPRGHIPPRSLWIGPLAVIFPLAPFGLAHGQIEILYCE
eukprot:7980421-Pyramimonas_sp.AAC.1